MTTFITEMDPGSGDGPMLAVKDLIDVIGVPTTAGCRAVAESARPATLDALCMAGARAGAARVVGKANLVELAYGGSGINEYFGTPRNPLDPARVPGGSSSGSAVAVASGVADIAYGSDSGGSIRIPSAFCGTAGLKTTRGRVPLEGVKPLAPSLDTVGPMARDVGGLILGMILLEPGFAPDDRMADVIGRLRVPGAEVDPLIDAAVDRALALAELDIVDVTVPGWCAAYSAGATILDWEAACVNLYLTEDPNLAAKLGRHVAARLAAGGLFSQDQIDAARKFAASWSEQFAEIFSRVQLIAGPTVGFFPPLLESASGLSYSTFTKPVNLAGLPAVSLPVPTGGVLPAGLQLIGPERSEGLILTTGLHIQGALR
jgi:amidase